MAEKIVYFVRHGETTGNVSHRHQPEKTRLTARGKEQAVEAGKKIARYQPTHLVVSSHVRAVETGRVIAEELDIVPETSELFRELIRPTIVMGYKHKSLRSLWYMTRWYLGKKFLQGESYHDFQLRLDRARQYLEALPDDSRIVVVSHAIFINMFVAHVCHTRPLGLLGALKVFFAVFAMPNTAVVKLKFSTSGKHCGWQIVE